MLGINHSCEVILNSDPGLPRNSVHKKCPQTNGPTYQKTDRPTSVTPIKPPYSMYLGL